MAENMFWLNGNQVKFKPGQTILEAAGEFGVVIPTLCHLKGATPTELCPVWGDCKLQDLAFQYQVKLDRFAPSKTKYPVETVSPMIVRDFSRCILCGRCVQACNEVQVNRAISFGYRGANSKIVASGDCPLVSSDCVFCGECVQACPVGALVEKKARYSAPGKPPKSEPLVLIAG